MLKRFRCSIGMTQEEFSKILGIPRSTYCKYELKKSKPRKERLEKINNAIDAIKANEISKEYIEAMRRKRKKTPLKRKILRLSIVIIIILILTVIY